MAARMLIVLAVALGVYAAFGASIIVGVAMWRLGLISASAVAMALPIGLVAGALSGSLVGHVVGARLAR